MQACQMGWAAEREREREGCGRVIPLSSAWLLTCFSLWITLSLLQLAARFVPSYSEGEALALASAQISLLTWRHLSFSLLSSARTYGPRLPKLLQ